MGSQVLKLIHTSLVKLNFYDDGTVDYIIEDPEQVTVHTAHESMTRVEMILTFDTSGYSPNTNLELFQEWLEEADIRCHYLKSIKVKGKIQIAKYYYEFHECFHIHITNQHWVDNKYTYKIEFECIYYDQTLKNLGQYRMRTFDLYHNTL